MSLEWSPFLRCAQVLNHIINGHGLGVVDERSHGSENLFKPIVFPQCSFSDAKLSDGMR
jgi:hypothetical protein